MELLSELPVADHPSRIAQLARAGATEEDIAAELQIPLARLRKRFRRELKRARAMGRNQILENVFEKAKSGESVPTTTFWLKSQCGWRDTGPSQAPPTIVRHILAVGDFSNSKPGVESVPPGSWRDRDILS